jgi:hypothetical protein
MTNQNLPAPPQMNRQTPSKGDNGGLLKIAGIALVVSIVAIFVYSYLIGGIATKKYTDTTFAPVSTLTQLQADIASAKSSLDTAIAGLPVTVSTQVNTSTSEFANRINQVSNDINALQSEINTLQSKVDNFNNSELTSKYNTLSEQVVLLVNEITALKDNLETYNTNLTNLTTRVTALETPTTTNPSSLTYQIKSQSEALVPSYDKKSISATVKLTITNTSTVSMEDIIISARFQTAYFPATENTTVSFVSSPTMYWYSSGYYYNEIEYHNGWGLNIEAGKPKTIYLTLTFTDTSPIYTAPTGYGYELDISLN